MKEGENTDTQVSNNSNKISAWKLNLVKKTISYYD